MHSLEMWGWMMFEQPSRSKMSLIHVFSVCGGSLTRGRHQLRRRAETERECDVMSACLIRYPGAGGPSSGGKKKRQTCLDWGLRPLAERSGQLYDWKGMGCSVVTLFFLIKGEEFLGPRRHSDLPEIRS